MLGLQRSGRIITSAAVLIVIVFCGLRRRAAAGHQGDRRRSGLRGRARRDAGADAPGPRHDDAARRLELVGAGAACAAGTTATASPRRARPQMPETLRVLRTVRRAAVRRGRRPVRAARGRPSSFRGPGFSVPGAVALRPPEPDRPPVDGLHRRPHDAIDRLLAGVQEAAQLAALAVTVGVAARGLGTAAAPALRGRRRRRLGVDVDDDGSPAGAGRGRSSSTCAADDLPEVQDLLELGNPTTHARPGEHGDEAGWVRATTRPAGGLRGDGAQRCRTSAPGRDHRAPVAPRARPGPGDDRAPDPPGRRADGSAPSACSPTTTSPAGCYHGSATSPPTPGAAARSWPDPASPARVPRVRHLCRLARRSGP